MKYIHLCNKNTVASTYLGTLNLIHYSTFTFVPFPGTSGWYYEATTKGTIITPSTNFIEWLSTSLPVNINKLGIDLLINTHNNYMDVRINIWCNRNNMLLT